MVGDSRWTGKYLEALLKSQIGQFLEELAVVDRMADEQGIQLTSQDEDDINNLAEEYIQVFQKKIWHICRCQRMRFWIFTGNITGQIRR